MIGEKISEKIGNCPHLPNLDGAADVVKDKLEKDLEESGKAKVWGAVKYFHPSPAYREIDWDKALIKTIPKVNAAKSPEEYAAAINAMLAALGDKNTRAEVFVEKNAGKNPVQTAQEPFRFADGVLTIDVYAAATTMTTADGQATNQMMGKMFESLQQAKALILDLRFPAEMKDEILFFYADAFLRNALLPALLDKPIVLSSKSLSHSQRLRIADGRLQRLQFGDGDNRRENSFGKQQSENAAADSACQRKFAEHGNHRRIANGECRFRRAGRRIVGGFGGDRNDFETAG